MAGRQKPWWEYLVDYVARPMSDWLTLGLAETGWHQYDVDRSNQDKSIEEILNSAAQDPLGAQGQLASQGLQVTPDIEKWLDNLISRQNTAQSQQWEQGMRDSSYLSAGDQLTQLGLSPSGVLSTGAASHNGVATADNSKNNVALQRYQQRMALAKQLLGMTSQMASAGIYGNAIGAARKSSAMLASQAAHSARMVTRYDANDNRIGRSISENLDPDFDFSQLF